MQGVSLAVTTLNKHNNIIVIDQLYSNVCQECSSLITKRYSTSFSLGIRVLGISRAFDSAPQAASSRILVLEDVPLVPTLIVRNLSSQGYEITETAEGSETVRVYQESLQSGRLFDLVILYLSIPNGMGGVRTMEKLRQLDSEVTAIVSSGYSDDPVMAKPAAYGFAAVLPKPYEPADMLRLVKNVISQRAVRND